MAAMAMIHALENDACHWQERYETAVHRSMASEAEAKEDMDNLSSQLQQLRSELAAEQDVRALEASTAAAAEDALISTVKSLEEQASRAATTHCKDQNNAMAARAMIHALENDACHWQERYETAVHRSMASEAEAKEDMDILSSQLQQLRSEVAAEQDVRALEASTAAAAEDALISTVKSLEEQASRAATTHCKGQKAAKARKRELTKQLSHRQHAAAEERSAASEANCQARHYASSQRRRGRWQDWGIHRLTRAALQECRASNGGGEGNIAKTKGTLLLYEAQFGRTPKTAAESAALLAALWPTSSPGNSVSLLGASELGCCWSGQRGVVKNVCQRLHLSRIPAPHGNADTAHVVQVSHVTLAEPIHRKLLSKQDLQSINV